MTIGKPSSEATKAKAPGSPKARRRTRRQTRPLRELSLETLREAVLELVRLAVEYESPYAPVDPDLTANDQANRRVIGELSGRDAVLKKVVSAVLDHRDRRQALVEQIRLAQALREIADGVRKRRQEWNDKQRQRRKQGEPRHTWGSSEVTRREIAKYMQRTLAWWQVPLPDESVLRRLVDEAVSRSGGMGDKREGLRKRLADVVLKSTDVSADTLEKTSAALGGHPQQAGQVKTPEDAARALNDDPVGGFEILAYLVSVLVDGRHPDRVRHTVMKAWSDEVQRTWHRADGASPPSSDDPPASP